MPQLFSSLRRLLTAEDLSAWRGLTLLLAAMSIGALLAGIRVVRSGRPSVGVVPAGYVALVNQQGVLLSDFTAQTATETGEPFDETTPAQRARVLHEMIDKELLVQRALALDVQETSGSVRGVMADAVDAQAAAPEMTREPSEAQLRAYYDEHRARYASPGTMTVRNLVLHVGGYQNADQTVAQAVADAVEAVDQLRSGASIDYITEHFGFVDADPLYDAAQLDFAAKLHLGAQLYDLATTLSSGEISEPTVAPDGVHVLVMQQRQPPSVEDFAAARSQVYSDFRFAQSDRAALEDLRFLRSQARILLAPGQSE